MDVTSLLNTAGSGASSKPARASASPSITESGHTVPSSALPTPSPERTLGPAEYDGSPRQNSSLWATRGYSLQLALESKPRSSSVCSFQAYGRTETESDDGHYSGSRNDSVCSAVVSASSHSPRNNHARALLSPRCRPAASNKAEKSIISPEQSDGEHGGTETKKSYLDSHGNLSTGGFSASMPQSRASSFTAISALQSGKEPTVHGRGTSLDRMASQRGPEADHESPSSLHGNGSMGGKMHKRTMSAPDIAQCSVARMPRHAAQPMISESTCSRPGDEQPTEEGSRGSSVVMDNAASMKQDQEAYCMFVKDCDTGSQLRKAISHLFGRNKACTLRIPKHVWVYYCRKHYQRIRYRNAKTYPLNQMELVKLQIVRLQAWSEENRKQNSGAYIRMWTLSLRKREQSRIENGGGTEDPVVHDARSSAGTAVPDWLIQRVASGYTTEAILEVAERLHSEIKDGHLAQVPEIEFLPDIVEADSGASSKSSRNGRRQSRMAGASSGIKTPKRKASESLDFGRRESSVYSDGRGGEFYPPPLAAQHGLGNQHHHHQHHHQHHGHYHHQPPAGEESYDVVSPSGKRARLVRGPVPVPVPYGPPRHDSAQLPPLASALSYGEMQPPQSVTRVPNVVVPRIQPPAYRRGSHHSYGTASPPDSYYPGQSIPGGPPRWDSYESSPHSARSDGAYALSSGEFRHGGGPPAPAAPRQSLPPISAQLEGRFPRSHAQPDQHRAGRPHHWRSASAYVPGDHHHHPRGVAPPMPPGRPLSSGHDAPPVPGYGRDYEQVPPPPPPPHHYGSQHEQHSHAWSRGHHQSPPPHAPRLAGPLSGHADGAWSREGRPVYGARP